MFSFENHAENEAEKLVPDFFLFFKKALYDVKKNSPVALFQYNLIALNLAYNKNKLHETLGY